MKLLCLLLSVYVMLLTAKPCCADTDCRTEAVAGKTTADKVPATGSDCADCPPFSLCSATASFLMAGPVVIELPVIAEDVAKHITIYKQPALQQIPIAIWQPPKLS